MKKLYVKYKKLFIFCITLVILCSSFCVSAFAVETVDGKLSFNIPIAQPQIERTETSGIAYAEILYNDSSAVEVVIISFSDLGLATETEPLRIFADVTYGSINFKINKRGIISMFRISSNRSNDIEISQGSNAQDIGVTSYFTNVKGFRVYGVDRVTSWASGSSDGLNNNFIVNYGSDIVSNERTASIVSSLESIENHVDDLENYVASQNALLSSIFAEQQKTNTFLDTISSFLQSKLDIINNNIEGVWGTVQDIRNYIVGNKEEQPIPDDTSLNEVEQEEVSIRENSSQGLTEASYITKITIDDNSSVGKGMLAITNCINNVSYYSNSFISSLVNWSMSIGLISFILGIGTLLSRFKGGKDK